MRKRPSSTQSKEKKPRQSPVFSGNPLGAKGENQTSPLHSLSLLMHKLVFNSALNDSVDKWLSGQSNATGVNEDDQDEYKVLATARPTRLGVGAQMPSSKISHTDSDVITKRIRRDLKSAEGPAQSAAIAKDDSDDDGDSRTKVLPRKKASAAGWKAPLTVQPALAGIKKRKKKKNKKQRQMVVVAAD